MTKQELNYYRRQLLTLKSRLGADLSQLVDEALRPRSGESSGGLSDVPLHMADLATDNEEGEIELDLLENDDQILIQVNNVLVRIEQGTYGRCENCQQEIAQARLKALSYARYCIRFACEVEDKTTV